MSEYYARGRAVIADATSFVCFVAGFLLAAPFAWPALRASFEGGNYDRGLAIFLARIFGTGLAAGLFGLGLGTLGGRAWQALHRWRRARRAGAESALNATSDAEVLAKGGAAAHGTDTLTITPAKMSCVAGPLAPSSYAAFARRVDRDADDRRYVESTSAEILTLTAWDGLDVAGVARLLSDGYGALFITDFAIDPRYSASHVEKTLIDFALRRVQAGGRLTRV